MTFNKDFLRKLQKRLNSSSSGSSLYPMTKYSVDGLLTLNQLQDNDQKIIFSSLVNDNSKYKDPFLLAVFWNDNINEPNLKFKF